MYIVGQEEIDALAKVIRSGTLFRYGIGSECERFEKRYADYLGVEPFRADGQRHLRPHRGDDRRSASGRATRC